MAAAGRAYESSWYQNPAVNGLDPWHPAANAAMRAAVAGAPAREGVTLPPASVRATEQTIGVRRVDLVLVFGREPQALDRLDRFPHVQSRRWIERHITRE